MLSDGPCMRISANSGNFLLVFGNRMHLNVWFVSHADRLGALFVSISCVKSQVKDEIGGRFRLA